MTTEIKSTQTDRIRTFNDELRKNFCQGHAVMTIGIATLGAEAVARIVKTIEVYDDFCHANDPYEEHDFGSFEADGHNIFSRSIISLRAPRCFTGAADKNALNADGAGRSNDQFRIEGRPRQSAGAKGADRS
jgi:hypothetical protein